MVVKVQFTLFTMVNEALYDSATGSSQSPAPKPTTAHSPFQSSVYLFLFLRFTSSLLPPDLECSQALYKNYFSSGLLPLFRGSWEAWWVFDFLLGREQHPLFPCCPLVDTLTPGLISFRLRD